MGSKELIVIDHKQFGLTEKKADSIAEAFKPELNKLYDLEPAYSQFEELLSTIAEGGEPTQDQCAAAKALRLKYVPIRTEISRVHKAEKESFLKSGKYVDAWKNKSTEISSDREASLKEIEEYFVRKEQDRINNLQHERELELMPFLENPADVPSNLGLMDDSVYGALLKGVKTEFEERKASEQAAEIQENKIKDRINRLFSLGLNQRGYFFYFGEDQSFSVEQCATLSDADFESEIESMKTVIANIKERQAQEEERLSKISQRTDRLLGLGILFDGSVFSYKDLILSSSIVLSSDEEFEKSFSMAVDWMKIIREEEAKGNSVVRRSYGRRIHGKGEISDKEKLNAFISSLKDVPKPELSSIPGKTILSKLRTDIGNAILSASQSLEGLNG